MVQSEQFPSTPEISLPKKKKKPRHLCRSLDCKMGESLGEREPYLGKRERDQSGSMERKRWTPQQGRQGPRRRGSLSKTNLPRTKHKRVSGLKSYSIGFEEYWFYSKSPKSEMKKGN